MKTPHLTPWKYFIRSNFWNDQSKLYTSLDSALLAVSSHEKIEIIPSGHAPWKPKNPDDKRPHSPLTYLGAWCWTVLRISRFDDHPDDPFINYLGELGHPFDAFALAELKTKQATERGDKWHSFYVCLWAYAENGCRPEIVRLPANHLTELRRARDRAERRKQRLAA